jgi:hypothetical protein
MIHTNPELLPGVVQKQTTPSAGHHMCNVELVFHGTKPIIGFQWISGMHEHWGTTLQKFTMLITWLCPSNWLILLVLY